MGQFSRTFKALNTIIRGSPSQNLPLTLSILDDLTAAQDLLARTTIPQDAMEAIRREINALEREAKGIGGVGVGDVVEDIKRRGQNIVTLPSDGGLIDLTTDVFSHSAKITEDNESIIKFNSILKTAEYIISVVTFWKLESV
jgi:hypothetical protein